MKGSTLTSVVQAIFNRDLLRQAALRRGAMERERKVKVLDFVLALVSAGAVGPERSIAAVRRAWEMLASETIAPKSFDAHFNPGMVRLLWELIHDLMAPSNRALRRQWPAPLRDLYDVLIIDGTHMAVDAGLSDVLRDTTPGKSALKLIGVLSLGEGHLTDVRAGAAVHHDRKLLRLGTLMRGALYLLDLGFYDHSLFAAYDDAGSFFVSRRKSNVTPWFDFNFTDPEGNELQCGLPVDALASSPLLDVDARLILRDGAHPSTRVFRVIKLEVPVTDRHDRPTGKVQAFWYITNLPRETWTAAMIVAAYRLRWAIERIWRETKHFARLDQLRSQRPVVLFIFVAASLLFLLLAECAVRDQIEIRGVGGVSRDRVMATLVAAWPDIARNLHDDEGDITACLAHLARVLAVEGRHPNPGQPRRITTVFATLEAEARRLTQEAA